MCAVWWMFHHCSSMDFSLKMNKIELMKQTFLTDEVHKSKLLWIQIETGTEIFWYVIAKLNFSCASLADISAFCLKLFLSKLHRNILCLEAICLEMYPKICASYWWLMDLVWLCLKSQNNTSVGFIISK